MAEDLVSVIVPVYNVANYLDICISSIVGQTYRSIEIILVDDGSTDNSGTLCDRWGEKDKRIQVIHKKNGGLSDARNAGLERAKGSYILFVDSDDYIHPTLVEFCFEQIVKYQADIVVYGLNKVGENGRKFCNEDCGDRLEKYYEKELLYEYVRNGTGEPIVCNKFYKYKIWKTLRFPKGKLHEDEFVIADILMAAKKLCYPRENYIITETEEGALQILPVK